MICFRKNFTKTPLADIPKCNKYVECNFSREMPDISGAQPVGWKFLEGDTHERIFEDCNLLNVEPPPGAVLKFCNTTIMEKNLVVNQHVVTIDGVQIATKDEIGHRWHGRFNNDTRSYEYLPTPEIH
jgi:hypothetical protein